MGPKDKKPPFPEFEWTNLTADCRYVSKFRLECNYLQAMEGDYDPSHAGFLHSTFLPPTDARNAPIGTVYRSPSNRGVGNSDPNEIYPKVVGDRRMTPERAKSVFGKLEDEEAALISIQTRDQADGKVAASVGVTWWMPIFCTAGNAMPGHLSSNMRVPIDNESLMFFRLRWSYDPMPQHERDEYKHGEYYYPPVIPGTWITKDNVSNDYNIDRVVQKNYTYTGIRTFPLQDIAMMQNQWGPIADRSQEHLTSSDYMIIYIRRRLLKAARALEAGQEPSEPWHPEAYRYRRTMVVADTEQEAIRQVREKAFSTELSPELQKVAIKA